MPHCLKQDTDHDIGKKSVRHSTRHCNIFLKASLKLFLLIVSIYRMEGDRTRMRSEFNNELDDNNAQFARIRDKNVNFVLCQFQSLVLYLQKECFEFLF